MQRVTSVIDSFLELMQQNVRGELPPGSLLAWRKLLTYTGSCFRHPGHETVSKSFMGQDTRRRKIDGRAASKCLLQRRSKAFQSIPEPMEALGEILSQKMEVLLWSIETSHKMAVAWICFWIGGRYGSTVVIAVIAAVGAGVLKVGAQVLGKKQTWPEGPVQSESMLFRVCIPSIYFTPSLLWLPWSGSATPLQCWTDRSLLTYTDLISPMSSFVYADLWQVCQHDLWRAFEGH